MSDSEEFARQLAKRLDESLDGLSPTVEKALANRRRLALQTHKSYWGMAVAASVLVVVIAWPLLHQPPADDADTLDNATALLMDAEPQMLEDMEMLEVLAEVADDQT